VVTLAPTGRVALIERFVKGRTYLSVPGGRLEAGESPEQAALREIEEELGLRVTLAGRLTDLNRQAYFLAVVPAEFPLVLSGPEIRHAGPNNRYTPCWVDAQTLNGLPLRQPGIGPLLVAAALAVSATASITEPPRVPADPLWTPDEDVIDLSGVDVEPAPSLPVIPESAWRLRRRFAFRSGDTRTNRHRASV
jgi:8-oxo-dGTP diphosphatase